MASVAAVSWLVGRHIHGKLVAAPPAATAAPTPPAPTYTVAGKVQLQRGQWTADGTGCRSTKVSPDAQIVVTDAHGASLAYAPLQAGRVTAGGCELPFTLTVPAGKGPYGVDVPGWGMAKYTEPELADTLELTYS